MLSSNPTFMGVVRTRKAEFLRLMQLANVQDVYTSKHFFERLVERNLDAVDAMIMATPMIKDFRTSTYNLRSYLVQWKNLGLVGGITVGEVTGKRRLILKTIFEKFDETEYDVNFRL